MPSLSKLLLLWVALASVALAQVVAALPRLPSTLVDVGGETVDLANLARSHKLFFVTLKSTSCPVCRAQLSRLMEQLPRLRSCDATFVVLSPGRASEIAAVRKEGGFPFPFVEDEGLELASSLGLRLSPTEMAPAIFAVDAKREIVWMQQGRSGLYFGDPELLDYLDCAALKVASNSDRTGTIVPSLGDHYDLLEVKGTR